MYRIHRAYIHTLLVFDDSVLLLSQASNKQKTQIAKNSGFTASFSGRFLDDFTSKFHFMIISVVHMAESWDYDRV